MSRQIFWTTTAAALVSVTAIGVTAATTSAKPVGATRAAASVPKVSLTYGVLAGLTGDLAQAGQPWTEGAKLAIDNINGNLKAMRLSGSIRVKFAGAQDSGGNATGGIEAARALAAKGVKIVIGDFFSSVTIAAAQSVLIPGNILDFTGGTNPAITDLADKGLVWRTVSSDALQGKVLAQVLAQQYGKTATINVAARNDAYGTGLADVFEKVWQAQGGKIGKAVIYNPDAPTLDSEAQSFASGSPDAWVFISFCGELPKLIGPLQRTGKWDANRSWGSDGLRGCEKSAVVSGMRGTQADSAGGGRAYAAFAALWKAKAKPSLIYQAYWGNAFDGVMVSFLASLAARSSNPTAISKKLIAVSGPPGTKYAYTQLPKAIRAVIAGKDIDYQGVTGPIDLDKNGDPTANVYIIWKSQSDGSQPVTGRVTLKT